MSLCAKQIILILKLKQEILSTMSTYLDDKNERVAHIPRPRQFIKVSIIIYCVNSPTRSILILGATKINYECFS